MEIVNIVWQGNSNKRFKLRKVARQVKNFDSVKSAVYQSKQPKQLIVKFVDKCTMLLFKTGKFRINSKCLTFETALARSKSVTRLKNLACAYHAFADHNRSVYMQA